jgi:hypothetical protein
LQTVFNNIFKTLSSNILLNWPMLQIFSFNKFTFMGERRCPYKVLVGKPEGRRPLGRPRHRWEDNTKMDLREVGWQGIDWINLAQDRNRWQALVNGVINLWVP